MTGKIETLSKEIQDIKKTQREVLGWGNQEESEAIGKMLVKGHKSAGRRWILGTEYTAL